MLLRLGHLLAVQALGDGVAVEVGKRYIVFVGEAAPDGTVDFLVEAVAVVLLEVFLGGFETLAGHADGVLAAHADNILSRSLATLADEECRKGKQQDGTDSQPETKPHMLLMTDGLQASGGMQVVDVAAEVQHIVFLTAANGGHLASRHLYFLLLNVLGDILAGGGVEEDESEAGYGVVAFAAGNEYPLVAAAAADAVLAFLDVVGNLRVVDLKDAGKFGRRGVDEHQVAGARNGDTIADGFVGFYLVEVGPTHHVETAHAACEAVGSRGQRTYIDVDAVGAECTLNGLLAAEEGVVEEVEDGAGAAALLLHHSQHIEVERLDGELAVLLREERPAAYLGHLIAAVADGLLILLYLAALAEVFGPEALVAWQFVDGELPDGYLGVNLIGDDNLLALVGVAFADGGTCEERLFVYLGGLRLLLTAPGVVGLLLRLTLAGPFLHLDGEGR